MRLVRKIADFILIEFFFVGGYLFIFLWVVSVLSTVNISQSFEFGESEE